MKYIFMVEHYPPERSASGSLARYVVEALEREARVVVVTRKPRSSVSTGSAGTVVHYLDLPAASRKPRRSILGTVRRFLSFVARVLGLELDRRYIRAAATTAQSLASEEDCIVPCTANDLLAALRLKPKASVSIVPFLMEVLPSSRVIHPRLRWIGALGWLRRKRAETAMLKHSRVVLALPTPARRLVEDYPSCSSKVVEVEHPMVRDETAVPPNRDVGRTAALVYAGALDRVARHPGRMLEVLSQVNQLLPLRLDVYSYGNCEAYIRDVRWSAFLVAHGAVAPDVAMTAMREGDVLVTHGNATAELAPSKVFDCISTGLPIVHFASQEEDPYIEYLRRYGLGLVVRLDDPSSVSAALLSEFLRSSFGKRVPAAQFLREFKECTPEHFVQVLRVAAETGV